MRNMVITKDGLATFMKVITRNGMEMYVFKDVFTHYNEGSYFLEVIEDLYNAYGDRNLISFDCYNDDLTSKDHDGLDIMEVQYSVSIYNAECNNYWATIWTRG